MLTQHIYAKYEYEYLNIWGKDLGCSAFYFEFNKHDSRYNNIKSMLISFINDMAWHNWRKSPNGPVIRTVLENLGYHHRWSLPGLFQLFTLIRQCPCANTCAIFLSCFDECLEDERTWFLTRVMEQFGYNDWNYRIVITTSGPDSSIKKFIPESQVLSMQDCPTGPKGYAIDERNLAMSEIGIIDWLGDYGRRAARIADIGEEISKLHPVTPENVLRVFIESQPKRRQLLGDRAYQWAKYAMELFTIEALGHAIAAVTLYPRSSPENFDHARLAEDISSIFCGIIIIENGDVKFSHPSFYSAGSNHEEPAGAHYQLAAACLRYLTHHEVQEKYSKFSFNKYDGDILQRPLIIPRDDFLEYAVRFWSEHYRLCRLALSPYDPQSTGWGKIFFQDKKEFQRWSEAYYLLSNPFTRIQRSYLSPLPVIAALGLQDLVNMLISDNKGSKWFQQDLWLAITEASRNGHADAVGRLLNEVEEVEDSALRDAIFWAASVGNEQAMIQLLEKVESPRSFPWPGNILFRAASAGLEPLVSALCGSGYDLTNGTTNSATQLCKQPSSGVITMWQRSWLGQPEMVQLLLDHGADINDKDNDSYSVAHTAVHAGQFQALDLLLKAGADVHSSDPEAYLPPPITLAASLNIQTIETCRLLLEHGADPNESSEERVMPLVRALGSQSKEMINLLIERGAKLDTFDPCENLHVRTPLSNAVWQCSVDMIEFLIEKGASVNYAPEGTQSPLFAAAYQGTGIEKAKLLLSKGADINWTWLNSWTVLHASYDAPEFVSLLLEHGADINAMSDDHGTVLMMAARWGHINTIRAIIAHESPKADLDLEVDPGDVGRSFSTLSFAVENQNFDCATLLLEAGAGLAEFIDPKQLLWGFSNPLPEEKVPELLSFMKLCLRQGTDASEVDEDKNTALHWLKQYTPVQVVKLLIDSGVPVNSLNDKVYLEMVQILADAGADPNTPGPLPAGEPLLYTTISEKSYLAHHRSVFRYLVSDLRVDVNKATDSGETPIIALARHHNLKKLRYLIRHGGDINAADNEGRRAIHYFSANAEPYIGYRKIRYFVKAGADLCSPDNYRRTPLHLAVGGGDPVECARIILKASHQGFNIDSKDIDGWTPLMYACRSEMADSMMLNMLVKEYGADIWPVSYDGQWSARKLVNLVDISDYDCPLELLEPPEDKREHIGPDGVKQIWDPAFHTTTPEEYINTSCESCLLPSSGQWHRCRDCTEAIWFCFKCFPHRNEVHETGHTFKRWTFFIESEDERSEHSGQDGEASDGEESDAFRAGSGSSGTEETDTETDDDDDDDDDDDE
ncbi:hypothetical protein NCS55_00644700 [Fusarium keratoplasticum]|nr:hypothetical protein NCS55_00644700 [Fusarium keratoplasticum]